MAIPRGIRRSDDWLVATMRQRVARPVVRRSFNERCEVVLSDYPFLAGFALQAVLIVLVLVLWLADASFLPSLTPEAPGSALETLWQVHVVFVSLAFAGLAILFQLGSEELVSGASLRLVLFRKTYFLFTLAFCGLSVVHLGAVAMWLESDATLLAQFVLSFITSVSLVGFAYHIAARLYLDPVRANALAVAQLTATLRLSQFNNSVVAQANQAWRASMPGLFRPVPREGQTRFLLAMDALTVVSDVQVRVLQEALDRVRQAQVDHGVDGGSDAGLPVEADLSRGPVLRAQCHIGGMVPAGRSLFSLTGPLNGLDLARLERQLRAAVRTERRT